MPKILNFIYCDNAKIIPTPAGDRQEIFGTLSALQPVSLPSNYTFCVVCNIAGLDSTRNNTVRFVFEDPNGEPLYNTNTVEICPPPAGNDGRKPDALKLNLELRNLVLEQEGEHKTKLYLNDKEMGEYPIEVKKVGNL